MNRTLKTLNFTIWHGVAASLVLHSALALPFVVNTLSRPPEELPTLVIELRGVVADAQTEERVAQVSDRVLPPPQAALPQQQTPPPEQQEQGGEKLPKAVSSPPSPQVSQAEPPDEQQRAQILRTEKDLEADRLREYVKRLTKKVQANLVYPDEGRRAGLQGNATVSFRLTADGQIKPGTLSITAGSGQPKLDASALATVRTCTPFEPPPREMTVAFVVGYGKKK